ncbi:hypothetical protein SO694_00115016 [Aureococcus anophagefferens]|uniref:Uncharacterized protein n=1 Tax=Aureococcus anophagefferens TaxID=44056 RepID=A0ABR1FWJ9_AURAN
MEALQALLEDAFASHADKPALLQPDGAAITFGELEGSCAALCAQLALLDDATGALRILGRVDDVVNVRGVRVDARRRGRARRGAVVVFAGTAATLKPRRSWPSRSRGRPDLAAVAAAARPSEVVRLDALPRGSAGKVDRGRCGARGGEAASTPAAAPGAPPAPADVSAVEAWLRELYAALAPGDGDDFLRRGGTSLGAAGVLGDASTEAAALVWDDLVFVGSYDGCLYALRYSERRRLDLRRGGP